MKKKATSLNGAEVNGEKTVQKEFAMALPLKVSGLDSCGHEFSEESRLASISSEEAVFFLKTKVDRQSSLKLVIPLPPKLADGQPLNLVLRGTVLQAVQSALASRQGTRVRLKLESRYFIGADEN
ncbi:MAG TPA: hypothetical protein PKH53_05240 [Candidatus Saccharicenans sp.]|nr:hypothetical protein [Candidatus Saccharicenans sp.]HNT01893.1 hypothetical protein [Candidatus Saccharicenans sp.]HUM79213.1 hypothetical protein [Candidatus Saccharicenans sp.]